MLELYQAEGCGYSAKVRETLTDLGVSYVMHNPRSAAGETRNEQIHNQLRTLGGEDQIPFLVDNRRGVTMCESDDIIAYLEEYYA
jgi:glutathione S-transferase